MPATEFELPERDVWTVSRLNREVRLLVESGLPALWLEGEVSNLSRPASGHLYFSLKDEAAQVRCALWRTAALRLAFTPRNGMQLLVRARVSVYEPRGEYQLIVEHAEDRDPGQFGDPLHHRAERFPDWTDLGERQLEKGLLDGNAEQHADGFLVGHPDWSP